MRELRIQLEGNGWWIERDLTGSVACPACNARLQRPEHLAPFRDLLRQNPRTLAASLVIPIRNAIQALARGMEAPTAHELIHLGHTALSRCHPYEPPGLREAWSQLTTLVTAGRALEGPPAAGNAPMASLADLAVPWDGSRPNPEAFRQEVMGEFQPAPDENMRATQQPEDQLPVRVISDPAVPRGRVFIVNEGQQLPGHIPPGSVIAVHPEEVDSMRQEVAALFEQGTGNPDYQVFTRHPLVGFSRQQGHPVADVNVPVARGGRVSIPGGEVQDENGQHYQLAPFEVDLPSRAYRIGVDLGRGDQSVVNILVDDQVIGTTTLSKSQTKFEKLLPKSSWERIMEDDKDECP
jgi:hypothetical protein